MRSLFHSQRVGQLCVPLLLFQPFVVSCFRDPRQDRFFAELRHAEIELSSPHRVNRSGAIEAYRRALSLGEQALGNAHPALVPPLMKLGRYEQVLAIYAANPALTGSTWRPYARTANLFGRSLTRREATRLYLIGRAVAINGLATTTYRDGHAMQAENLYRQALQVLLRLHDPLDPLLSSQFAVLALMCQERQDWTCAERLRRRILAIRQSETRRVVPEPSTFR